MGQLLLLGAGGAAGGPTVLLRDLFTDADATNLSAHTMDVGAGWTVHAGSIAIHSNRAQGDRTGGDPLASADAGVANVQIAATLSYESIGNNDVALVARLSDATHYWYGVLSAANQTVEIYEVNAGYTQRASTAFSNSPATNYAATLTATGTTLTFAVGATSCNYSSSFNQSATRHGLAIDHNGTALRYWDTFEVTAT